MGTRSTISIHQKDSIIKSVYCHYDGYYEHNGVILYNFYDTPEKVQELISYGDMSSLGTSIGKKHDFNDFYYGCTFYHRDRDEDLSINKYVIKNENIPYNRIYEEEYNYIFLEETQEWIVKKEFAKYYKLEEIFDRINLNEWAINVNDKEQYEKLIEFYKKFGKSDMKIPTFEEVKYEI